MDDGRQIVRNAIRCNHCNDEIESTHTHDFKSCYCGAVAVDGGKSYLKRMFKTHPDADYVELTTYE